MKRLIFAMLLLTGCAGQTPFQKFSAALDSGAPLPAEQVLIDAANVTLEWANGPDGPSTESARMGARLCPEMILVTLPDQRADVVLIRNKVIETRDGLKGIGDGNIKLHGLLWATQAKYGDKQKAHLGLDALKTRAFNRFSTVVDVCSTIIPKQQIIQLLGKFYGLP